MNKRLITVLLSFFPILAFAESGSMSFAPPASDYSMIFLGNLFGVVDGVLHGTGSQIMGTMFSVFNSAVLAIGGLIIMYTLIISTMNTAHEGQMLGQKWSSIWIPLRSTMGLALLIPKASGYCLMQIFVMWIVAQGVGAADKVWDAALGYLNRGGVIIKSQTDPTTALLATVDGSANAIPTGAKTILIGQVCMLGIQKQLESARKGYLKNPDSAPCAATGTGSVDPQMALLCKNAVPDFLSTVNFVTIQQNADATARSATPPKADGGPYKANMPSFPDQNDPYHALDGICGSVQWAAIPTLNGTPTTGQNSSFGTNTQSQGNWYSISGLGDTTVSSSLVTLSSSELNTAQLSRAIAIQQMYVDLSSVAQVMIGNDPQMNPDAPAGTNFSNVANQQFGVPYTSAGSICSKYSDTCTSWGPTTSGSGNTGVLFNGTEFQGAISDYNGIMFPTLNLIKQINEGSTGTNARAFITKASSQGWMMAGSYFFDLVTLNGNAKDNSSLIDTGSGLGSSTAVVMTQLPTGSNTTTLMKWLGNYDNPTATPTDPAYPGGTKLNYIIALINGASGGKDPSVTQDSSRGIVDGTNSSTVWGFLNNSLMVQMPGQPGLAPLQFANVINFTTSNKMYYLEQQDFSCGRVKTFVFSFCLGALLGDIFYNLIIYTLYNALIFFFQQIIQQVIMAFIMIPIQGLSSIFKQGLQTISEPGVNPIIALAQMGVMYINFSGNLWMMLMNMAVISALLPLLGIFIFALMAFVMPLLLAWIGIMVSVGFTTAYYIPILPYMIFTFGSIAWLISVIEAMVAAPIVALGITHPEGHEAFGKGEAAIMLLMNVFLRPAMMIIGYISAIALSYVSVWILNAGFDHAISYVQGGNTTGKGGILSQLTAGAEIQHNSDYGVSATGANAQTGSGSGGYSDWAGIYAYFFSILTYTTMYLTVVQKSFTLISYLPDKVLRWIGGSPDSLGGESAQWGDEMVKGKSGEAAKGTQDAQGQMGKQLGGYGQKAVGAMSKGIGKAAGKGSTKAKSGDSESSAPPMSK